MDVASLSESARPGGVVSGLIAGYIVIYDELGIPYLIRRIVQEVSREEGYIVIKNGRRLNLSTLAKVKNLRC